MNMATPVDLTSFTADQKLAFAKAAALSPTPVNTIDRTISAASLAAPTNPLTIPTYNPPPVINTPAPDFGVAAKQNAVTGSESDYKAALEQQGQFTARTQELEAASGVPGLAARLNELNALDVGYQSDLANIASQNLQGTVAQQGTPTSEVGRQINLKDLNYNTVIAQQNTNIKRAVNNAVIASVQGQLANAQANIQRALDLEFKPLASKIQYLENVLSQNRDSLSKAEQNQLQYQITQQTRAYEEGQQNKKDIYSVMTEAAKNGADNATLAAIQGAKDPFEAIQLAGQFAGTIAKPASVQEYEYAVMRGYKGSFSDYQNEDANRKKSIAAAGAVTAGAPNSYKEWELAGKPGTYAQWLKDSNVKAPTVAQQTVAEYAARLEQSNPIIGKLQSDIVGMNLLSFNAQLRLPPSLQSSTMQQYMQAARNFINAKLRRESGAVISDSEFIEARGQYLPQPGDSTEVLSQKKANRDLVYASMRSAAGSAYQSVEDLLGSNAPSSAPKTIEYPIGSGKRYSVDAAGNMTPL